MRPIAVTAPPYKAISDQHIVAVDGFGKVISSKPLSTEIETNIKTKLGSNEGNFCIAKLI